MNADELLKILCAVWNREISADEGFDEIYGEVFDCNEDK